MYLNSVILLLQINVITAKKTDDLETNTGKTNTIALPKSNVLQFLTADGAKITVRPSGTEPKIKFYFSVKATSDKTTSIETGFQQLDEKIKRIAKHLGL